MIKYPYEVKYADIGSDLNIAYCDEGKGKTTVIFIHGLANYLPVFKHNIDEVAKHARCIALDLPGNGLSSHGDYPFTLFFYAESVARFIQYLKLEKVILVGHSMGGQVSTILALRYPHLVQQLVLLAPSGFEHFSDLEKSWMKSMMSFGNMLYSDAAGLESAILSSYYGQQKLDAKHIIADLKKIMEGKQGKYYSRMVKLNIEAMLNEQLGKFLPEITQPVHLFFGMQDGFIPNKIIHMHESIQGMAKKCAALIPQCDLHLIPQCGHFIQIEAAKEVNQKIISLLNTN